MRLPPYELPRVEWPVRQMERWTVLVEKAARMERATGQNDAFERMLAVLRNMASTGRFDGLADLLKRRLAARALSWLWLNDEVIASRLLNPRLMEALLEAQQPRLTRMTLQQLAQLYFRRFDLLDEREGLRQLLEQSLQEQLQKLPASRFDGARADPLLTLMQDGSWLLGLDGPSRLAERVRKAGRELGESFAQMGLQGFDDGRYGDVCRAHFYLETLRNLTVGEWDPVMDELLKPSVSKAPYQGNRRIGHAALEVLIDRAGQEPGDAWQNFILNMAGDPRIASSAPNYREWWLPLGEARIQKVRGWLSKEDLRLFLQAVEQYGLETDNHELQRMFPARKLFLEGLFKLKLIRNTRLLLGGRAQLSVKRILGKEVKTSFAKMDGQMNDKAVIYLDCGDFHLVEGSHSFKIWVYLAAPGEALRSYERNTFSHGDLITIIPATYKKLYPRLPYEAIVHTPHTWQSKVFQFLADNGIALDIEQLLSKQDYKLQLAKFGIPVVGPKAARVEPVAQLDAKPDSASASQTKVPLPATEPLKAEPRSGSRAVRTVEVSSSVDQELKETQLSILRYLSAHPKSLMGDIRRALEGDEKLFYQIQDALRGSLSSYVQRNDAFQWSLSDKGELYLEALLPASKEAPVAQDVGSADVTAANKKDNESGAQPQRPLEQFLLHHIKHHPGCSTLALYGASFDQGGTIALVESFLQEGLSDYVELNAGGGWCLSELGERYLKELEETGDQISVGITPPVINFQRIGSLKPFELRVLRYFYKNPSDKVRYAANVLGVEAREINQVLYGALKKLCKQDAQYGWHLTDEAKAELEAFDQK